MTVRPPRPRLNERERRYATRLDRLFVCVMLALVVLVVVIGLMGNAR